MTRCDLHVHSFHSGKTSHVTLLEPMDSYNTPERIYAVARARGMDLVTITDHDRIAGCLEFLDRHPDAADFFISEEITVPLPRFDYTLHVGAYGLSAADHAEIQRRRGDLAELLDYLDRREILAVWNHPFFHFPLGRTGLELLEFLLERFRCFEGINSCLPPGLNDAFASGLRERVPRGRPPALVGGSDSHSLIRIGRSWTEAPGGSPGEYLASLRRGLGVAHGNNGRFTGVFGDAMSVYLGYFREIAWRDEVHRDWSAWKKIRNSAGWAVWLPVFTASSFIYALIQFRIFSRREPSYRRLWRELEAAEGDPAHGRRGLAPGFDPERFNAGKTG